VRFGGPDRAQRPTPQKPGGKWQETGMCARQGISSRWQRMDAFAEPLSPPLQYPLSRFCEGPHKPKPPNGLLVPANCGRFFKIPTTLRPLIFASYGTIDRARRLRPLSFGIGSERSPSLTGWSTPRSAARRRIV
jgi:hypothetical protein